LILFLVPKKKTGSFLNAYITYKTMLTISIIVSSVEYSFSKLKLIKSYLWIIINDVSKKIKWFSFIIYWEKKWEI